MRRVLLALGLALLPAPAGAAAPEAGGPEGTWYLNANGGRLTLVVEKKAAGLTGTIADEGQPAVALVGLRYDPVARRLEWRRPLKGLTQWSRATLTEGVLVGRFSRLPGAAAPVWPRDYTAHVTGWNAAVFDRDLAPRVFEAVINRDFRARIRIDRAPGAPRKFVGRLKVYSTLSGGSAGEEPENDLAVSRWDGTNLHFVRTHPTSPQAYTATVHGRTVSGTFTQKGMPGAFPWSGARAEVFSYGLAGKTEEARAAWQRRTRARLEHLMMGGNPAPLEVKVKELRRNLPPLRSKAYPPDRDDEPARWPQAYRRTELQIDCAIPSPHGGPAIARRLHGWLAVPAGKLAPGARRPALLAVNGHGGSAWQMLDPDSGYFWYGDSFARRGYVVLALDISHRPEADRRGLYRGGAGDDPGHGNGPHPAVKAAGLSSDWEEDGERVWDAMRGIDYLLSRPDVDAKRLVVTGLSMGGEVTTQVGALDPRVSASVPAGYSPDMGVMLYNGNCPCWRWINADVREYVDVSDFHALTAPRPLLIQTGRRDGTFSRSRAPFAGDRQVVRRARAAYGKGPLAHYLHYDEHHYHVGGLNPSRATERGVRVPLLDGPPVPGDVAWQADRRTRVVAPTLFDWLQKHLR